LEWVEGDTLSRQGLEIWLAGCMHCGALWGEKALMLMTAEFAVREKGLLWEVSREG